jgi:hypothetical protein
MIDNISQLVQTRRRAITRMPQKTAAERLF